MYQDQSDILGGVKWLDLVLAKLWIQYKAQDKNKQW